MKFLIDENVGQAIVEYLRSSGHTVALARDIKPGTPDTHILAKAEREAWIIITHDLDFGQLVFEELERHAGVILLRLRINNVTLHLEALKEFLASHTEMEIKNRFWSLDERVFMK